LLSSHCRTASEHHPTNAWVVLRVDGSAQGKNGQKVRGHSPYVDPAPEKVWGGGQLTPGPRGSAAPDVKAYAIEV